jgi:ParB family chromosome partitioning protein
MAEISADKIADIGEKEAIEIDKLIPLRNHPFQTYEGERLKALADSIDKDSMLQPIVVRPDPIEEGKFEIIIGHNRVNALKILGHNKVWALVKKNVSDDQAMMMAVDSNTNQQSFDDWNYSQRIRVIGIYSKYITENSQQGKRNDLEDKETCVQSEHKSVDESKPAKRPKTRDKISKQLGISSTAFGRYRSIANISKLDDEVLSALCNMLDEKRICFMVAYNISRLRLGEIKSAIGLLRSNPEFKPKVAIVKLLYDRSKESKEVLTKKEIKEILLSDEVIP